MDAYVSKPATSRGISEAIAEVLRPEPEPEVISTDCPHPSSPFPWDGAQALERVDGDETLLRELVQIFLDESPKQLARLQQAIATSNPDEIERTAHSLKGELSYLGLPNAATKAKDLERMGHERALQLAADLFRTFQAEVSAGAAAMRGMLDDKHEPVDRSTAV